MKLLYFVLIALYLLSSPPIVFGADSAGMAEYKQYLAARILKCWFPPKMYVSDAVSVHFELYGDGELRDVDIVQPGSNVASNVAALQAVRDAAPFRALPIPGGFQPDQTLAFQFKFGGPIKQTPISRLQEATPIPPFRTANGTELGPYAASVLRAVRKHWTPSDPTVVAAVTIHSDGTIQSTKVINPGADKKARTAATAAIKSASPFRNMPEGAPNTVTFEITFNKRMTTSGMRPIKLR